MGGDVAGMGVLGIMTVSGLAFTPSPAQAPTHVTPGSAPAGGRRAGIGVGQPVTLDTCRQEVRNAYGPEWLRGKTPSRQSLN